MLQITSVGDGAKIAWEKLTSTFVELADRELECGEDIVKLVSNHFATIRHEDDIYSGPLWPPILENISKILESSLNMRPLYDHAESNDIVDQVEATFVALEPFLEPKKESRGINWPMSDQTQLFFDLLLRRYKLLSRIDPGRVKFILENLLKSFFGYDYDHCRGEKLANFVSFRFNLIRSGSIRLGKGSNSLAYSTNGVK